ncbi:MAG: phosphoribosyl-ATP pyrophosphohydrolase [Candidatus Wallbacteria bacterium HGW-Wallbacteria-1]|jgi:predicted house-cleaning noncanonical NTP pyrophosphatase (MazG superfamily)|uniref:Phosphoribosyl-ATP pyrophosphohydrolase n=1 Tax=Candidatus Wallbacteria bacterium HGW-Wallbacteria-1 TaxID=2013854 RepID=A0A2N1PS77_9BACT|nr:MAG: phosphoribosyl-ATP pyrophosphohydrolase [Candidatus Wallbacteria bacterium HGW-Wallbacteria-1]
MIERFFYNKLIRDRIPEIIQSRGKVSVTRVLDHCEVSQALDEKLLEEVSEYLESGSLEELADILEVMRGIVEVRGESWQNLEAIRADKSSSRGGFAGRIFLESVESLGK